MSYLRFSLALAALCLAAAGAASAQGGGPPLSDEAFAAGINETRERIARERAALLSGFNAQEQACRTRFFVNSCLRDLAERKREALAPLREQEIQTEEAERQRRRDQAVQRTADKQVQAERAPAGTPEQAAERQRRVQAERQQDQAEREAQARQRAQVQADRERAAEQRQREREQAARGRARRGDGAPLPPPTDPSR